MSQRLPEGTRAIRGPGLEILQTVGDRSVKCLCDAGLSPGPFAADQVPICEKCGHEFSKHEPHEASSSRLQTTASAFEHTICRREDTVEELFRTLEKHIVVQVRGTPLSGKTCLASLLHDRVKKGPDTQANLHNLDKRQLSARNPIRRQTIQSNPRRPRRNLLAQENVILINDEAHESHSQLEFWIQCVKMQACARAGPHIILFYAYGSPGTDALWIEISGAATLVSGQRMSLKCPRDQVHGVGLCFTIREFEDICERWTGGRSKIGDDVKGYIYGLTGGHPGGLRRSVGGYYES